MVANIEGDGGRVTDCGRKDSRNQGVQHVLMCCVRQAGSPPDRKSFGIVGESSHTGEHCGGAKGPPAGGEKSGFRTSSPFSRQTSPVVGSSPSAAPSSPTGIACNPPTSQNTSSVLADNQDHQACRCAPQRMRLIHYTHKLSHNQLSPVRPIAVCRPMDSVLLL